MAEIIETGKESHKKRGPLSVVILIVVVVVLVIVGYVASRCTDCGLGTTNNVASPLVGELDYNKPFGPFLGLPIEEGVDLNEATLTQYEGTQEIVSISYNPSKNSSQVLKDFETFFGNNGWGVENKDEVSIYGTKGDDSINVLVEKKNNKVLATISYSKEIGE